MISTFDVQTSLIAQLNALITAGTITPSTLTCAEFNYQGSDYSYPCLRVSVDLSTRARNGGCQPTIAAITIIAYSEQPSSGQAAGIAESVAEALNNRRLTIESLSSSPLRAMSMPKPVPLGGERGWATHVTAECEVPTGWR